MIDAVVAEKLSASEAGLRAFSGYIAFSISCSSRDRDRLLSMDLPCGIVCRLEPGEEAFHLVGFADESRRELYLELRKVAGIGRASALAVLDCGEVVDVLRAVVASDKTFFKEVPGLGPKRVDAVCQQLEKRYRRRLPAAPVVPARWIVEAREALHHGSSITLGEADEVVEQASKTGVRSAAELLAVAQASTPGAPKQA